MNHNLVRRFPFSVSDESQPDSDSLPRLPLLLEYQGQTLEVRGLVDSGATVNVLPYRLGRQLGAVWTPPKATLRLAGNLTNAIAQPLFVFARIADLPPVRLAFAWTMAENIPLILGQTNFFTEFEVCFVRAHSYFEIKPNAKPIIKLN